MKPVAPAGRGRVAFDVAALALIALCLASGAYLLSLPKPQTEQPAAEPKGPAFDGPAITFPLDGAIFDSPLVTFQGRAEPGQTVQLVIDTFGVQSETAGWDGRWFMQYSMFTTGKKTAYVRVLEKNGSFGKESARVSFTVRTRDATRLEDPTRIPGMRIVPDAGNPAAAQQSP
jgi:hypothetical protein